MKFHVNYESQCNVQAKILIASIQNLCSTAPTLTRGFSALTGANTRNIPHVSRQRNACISRGGLMVAAAPHREWMGSAELCSV